MSNVSSLSWGVKESLLGYIESLDDGAATPSGGAARDGMIFTFPLDEASTDFDSKTHTGTLQFSGSVVFSGYGGQMRIELTDPRLTLNEGSGTLAIRLQSMFTGERFEPIATVKVTSSDQALTLSAKLSPQGVAIFGPQYQVGQELSPIIVN